MTRSQRRIRARKLGELHSDAALAAIGVNTENPNRGMRHAARMTDAFLVDLARDCSKAYAPLTIATRFRDKAGRNYPDRRAEHGSPADASYSSYTV